MESEPLLPTADNSASNTTPSTRREKLADLLESKRLHQSVLAFVRTLPFAPSPPSYETRSLDLC